MTTRNDIQVVATKNDVQVVKGYTHESLNIPEGTMLQKMAAYERLPTEARKALQDAAFDHSPYRLLRTAQSRKWDTAAMVAAVARADERKRAVLNQTGFAMAA